jgi:uncharacterized protein
MVRPIKLTERIEVLDVVRGFSLLGILLLNIIAFGLVSQSYINPSLDLPDSFTIDWAIWGFIEVTAEGAMRGIFSILFGAGIVLFCANKSQADQKLFLRRNFFLLCFGIVDAYFLLWYGDILITYAVAGFILYYFRNLTGKTLLKIAVAILCFTALLNYLGKEVITYSKDAYIEVNSFEQTEITEEKILWAEAWDEFRVNYQPNEAEIDAEVSQRRGTYVEVFAWNAERKNIVIYSLPFYLWDIFLMMVLGMALFKMGILQGERNISFYKKLAVVSFTIGLAVNFIELYLFTSSGFDYRYSRVFLSSYDLGRLGMALGYISVINIIIKADVFKTIRQKLQNVGRMALTNYILHSIICMVLFTGVGFSLVNELSRSSLYLIVLAIWVFQIYFSGYWLKRYQAGPLEWLWRNLTYKRTFQIKREI